MMKEGANQRMEIESYDPKTGLSSKTMANVDSSSSTELIDISVQHARNKKENIDSNMDLIKRLMIEVECKEKAAAKAKEEADKYRPEILAQVEKLKKAQQIAKETNDMNSREVYTQKAALASEMKELQDSVAGMLNGGDESITVLDEMRRSLENRLSSAVLEKEAADKKHVEDLNSLMYEEQQMAKLKEESKRLKQEALDNSKLQQFLKDRGHVINMLKEEISCKRVDVYLLKRNIEHYQDRERDIEDYQDRKGEIRNYKHKKKLLVPEEYCSLEPIVQEIRPAEEYKVNGCSVAMKKGWLRDHTSRSVTQNSKNKANMEWIHGEIQEALMDYNQGAFDMNGYGCYSGL